MNHNQGGREQKNSDNCGNDIMKQYNLLVNLLVDLSQLKQNLTFNIKNFVNELPYEFPKDSRLKILRNVQISKSLKGSNA